MDKLPPQMGFNFYEETYPDVLRALSSPAKMRLRERLLIYSLILGLEPARVLEIGTDRGGTAQIIVEAMNYVGSGKLICVDPHPVWDDGLNVGNRATLITGRSPDVLPSCFQAADGLFDVVLIDGDHEYESVSSDLDRVVFYVDDGGYILLHDHLYPPVMRAIRHALESNPNLTDCGALTMQPIDFEGTLQGGLYLLRVKRR